MHSFATGILIEPGDLARDVAQIMRDRADWRFMPTRLACAVRASLEVSA